jgi:hypothetical protein
VSGAVCSGCEARDDLVALDDQRWCGPCLLDVMAAYRELLGQYASRVQELAVLAPPKGQPAWAAVDAVLEAGRGLATVLDDLRADRHRVEAAIEEWTVAVLRLRRERGVSDV